MTVTAAVVLLSIVSLAILIAAGVKDRRCRSYGVCAAAALDMMLVGALGTKLVFRRRRAVQRVCRNGVQRSAIQAGDLAALERRV